MPPKQPPDPNKLVRQSAGTYRSGDERFEVRQAGTGWFLVDTTQANELGQELVTGPFATLAAVREAIPEARRTTVKALPRPKGAKGAAKAAPKPRPRREPEPEPEPEPEHLLRTALMEAARDRFPPADLAVEVLEPPPGKADAVVAFTGHSIIAADVSAAKVRRQLGTDDPGAPMNATFLAWLARQLNAEPGSLDVVLVAAPGWVPPKAIELERVARPGRSERVERARRYRSDVEVHTDAERRGLVIIGRGPAGRLEVSIEIEPEHRGHGLGADLARAALRLAGNEPLFAQVAPGNVASLRAFLAAGYKPIGAEVLFLRKR